MLPFKMLIVSLIALFPLSGFAQTEEEGQPLTEVMNFGEWNTFAESISKCTEGTFVLPDPYMIKMMQMTQYANYAPQATITYKIVGMRNNRCEVDMVTNTIAGVVNNVPTFAPVLSHCSFANNSLITLYNHARDIANGREISATDNPVKTLMDQSCKLSNPASPAPR